MKKYFAMQSFYQLSFKGVGPKSMDTVNHVTSDGSTVRYLIPNAGEKLQINAFCGIMVFMLILITRIKK